MSRLLTLCGFAVLLTGCSDGTGGADADAAPIYEAVLKHAFPDKNKDQTIYLFIEGKDPAPEVLKKLSPQWPKLEAGSKVPKGKVVRINISDLKTGRDSAELRGTVSNGMDGQSHRYWLIRKTGGWAVEKTKLEAES